MSTTSSSRAISRATADNARNTRTFSKSVTPKATAVKDAPVFKVQLFMGSRKLRPGDQHFQGITDFECIQEGNLFRYTTGSSTNYNEIYRLRKSLLEKFPDAFIIAYKNGEKMDVNAAIREFLANKRK